MKNFSLQFLQAEVSRVSDWIRFADRKGAFLAVYYSAIFGFIISQKEEIIEGVKSQNCLLVIVLVLLLVAFLKGIYSLFRSMFPVLENPNTDKSLFYFGSIATMKFVDYSQLLGKITDKEAKNQLSEQIHTNSFIANQKMGYIQKSTRCLFALVLLSAIFILSL